MQLWFLIEERLLFKSRGQVSFVNLYAILTVYFSENLSLFTYLVPDYFFSDHSKVAVCKQQTGSLIQKVKIESNEN